MTKNVATGLQACLHVYCYCMKVHSKYLQFIGPTTYFLLALFIRGMTTTKRQKTFSEFYIAQTPYSISPMGRNYDAISLLQDGY